MNTIYKHNHSSEWKEAMDFISQFFKGLTDMLPSNVAGYCKLKCAYFNSWTIEQMLDEYSKTEEMDKVKESFWWDEWILLLDSLEDQFDIHFPREGEIDDIYYPNNIESFMGINYELPIEKLAEIVSLLLSEEELPREFLLWENISNDKGGSDLPWSDSLIQFTKDVLNELPIPAFMKGYCILKSIDRKYGKITLEDAIGYRYNIKNIDNDELIVKYDSLDDLLKAGWVAD